MCLYIDVPRVHAWGPTWLWDLFQAPNCQARNLEPSNGPEAETNQEPSSCRSCGYNPDGFLAPATFPHQNPEQKQRKAIMSRAQEGSKGDTRFRVEGAGFRFRV